MRDYVWNVVVWKSIFVIKYISNPPHCAHVVGWNQQAISTLLQQLWRNSLFTSLNRHLPLSVLLNGDANCTVQCNEHVFLSVQKSSCRQVDSRNSITCIYSSITNMLYFDITVFLRVYHTYKICFISVYYLTISNNLGYRAPSIFKWESIKVVMPLRWLLSKAFCLSYYKKYVFIEDQI